MNNDKITFEEAYQKLSDLVKQMEQGELTLEQSIKAYEEGKRLKECCEKFLKEAELKISIVSEK